MSHAKKHDLSADFAPCEEAAARLEAAVRERLQLVLLTGRSIAARERVLRAFVSERRAEGTAPIALDFNNDHLWNQLAKRLSFERHATGDDRAIHREWNLRLAVLELEQRLLCITAKLDSPLSPEQWERLAPLFIRPGTVLLILSTESRTLLPANALGSIDLTAEVEHVACTHPLAVDLSVGLESLAAAEAATSR